MGVVSASYGLTHLFQPVVVVGESMSPTLSHGRLLFVDRTYYRSHRPATGEVVMFAREGEIWIKRIYRVRARLSIARIRARAAMTRLA